MDENVKLIKSIRQMYDENGNAFYPVTATGAIFGDINHLNIGNTKNVIDLSYCLALNFKGTFTVTNINNMFFFYNIDCYYGTEGAHLPVNKQLIVASNIPASYRILGAVIPLHLEDGMSDSIKGYITDDGGIIAEVSPTRNISTEEAYESSITRVRGSGFFVKYQANNINEQDKYGSMAEFGLRSTFGEDTIFRFELQATTDFKIESINENGYVVGAELYEDNPKLAKIEVKIPKTAVRIKVSGNFKIFRYQSHDNIKSITVGNMQDLAEFCILDRITGKQAPSIEEFSMGRNNIWDMTEMFCDCVRLKTIKELYTMNTKNFTKLFYNCSSLVELPSSLMSSNVTSTREMFYGCSLLEKAPYMDTSKTNNMSYMFGYNYKLSEVPQYNYENVDNISYMFYSCNILKELKDFNTEKCQNFERAFQNCNFLLKIGEINLVAAVNIYSIFEGDANLESVKMNNLRLEHSFMANPKINAASLNYLLDNIGNPKSATYSLDIQGTAGQKRIFSGNWNVLEALNRGWTIYGIYDPKITFIVPKVTTRKNMKFRGASDANYRVECLAAGGTKLNEVICTPSVTATDFSMDIPLTTEKIIVHGSMVILQYDESYAITEIDVEDMPMLSNISTYNSASGKYDPCCQIKTIRRFSLGENSITNMASMFSECNLLNSIPRFYTDKVVDMNGTFFWCTALSQIPEIRTKLVKNFAQTFDNCTSLVSLPELDTSSATNTEQMFRSCTSMKSFGSFDLALCKNTEYMFNNCVSITSINAIKTTTLLETATGMFAACQKLKSIPLFNTSNCKNAGLLFYDCQTITTIPVFDFKAATDTQRMFYNCINLVSTPNLNLNVSTNGYRMFYNCPKLVFLGTLNSPKMTNMREMFKLSTSLVSIPTINSGAAKDMTEMFYGCTKLLSVSGLGGNTSNVQQMPGMFQNCTSMMTMPNFNTSKVLNMENMYRGCTNLLTIEDRNNALCTNFNNIFRDCINISGTFKIHNLNNTQCTDMFIGTKGSIIFIYTVTNAGAVNCAVPANVTKQQLK